MLPYPRAKAAVIAGSDVAHAVQLTLVAGLGHWYFGNIDPGLLGALSTGSLPGIVIGSAPASPAPDIVPRPSPAPGIVPRPALALVLTVVGVSLHINAGGTFGLVGEPGCGKSSLARMIMRPEPVTIGCILFGGSELDRLGHADLRRALRNIQIVFHDLDGSVDPRWTVGRIGAEPLATHEGLRGQVLRDRVRNLLSEVGIDPDWSTVTPARCPAASASASRSPCTLASSWRTMPCPRWTFRYRRA